MGMDKQVSLSGLRDELAQVRTKKKEFLSQIERIVPWGEWLTLIRPYYYKGERGNKPYDLERMPPKRDEFDTRDYSDTMFPEGIETVHPRFAISWRNKWMIKQSDYVVTYVTHSWGGAAQFAELAERQRKTVINVTVKADGV